jgi:hypothetical protein
MLKEDSDIQWLPSKTVDFKFDQNQALFGDLNFEQLTDSEL